MHIHICMPLLVSSYRHGFHRLHLTRQHDAGRDLTCHELPAVHRDLHALFVPNSGGINGLLPNARGLWLGD